MFFLTCCVYTRYLLTTRQLLSVLKVGYYVARLTVSLKRCQAMNAKAASHHCAHEWQPNESSCRTETN